MKVKSKASTKFSKAKQAMAKMRADLAPLVARANQMIKHLISSGQSNSSAAFQRAMKTLRPSKRAGYNAGTEEMFTTSYTRARELSRESSRLKQFLSLADSQVHLSEAQQRGISAALKHRISFKEQGANLRTAGVRFIGVQEDRMKLAAQIYRMIERNNTGIYGGYGSDNLINLIYDELEGYNPAWADMSDEWKKNSDPYNNLIKKALDAGTLALKEHRQFVEGMALKGMPYTGDTDLAVLEGMENVSSAQDYLNKFNF